MDNRCYIIMPPGDPGAYSQGHFGRVYDYVIVPACRAAGYWPTRCDTIKYENPLDVVKDIIDSEVVLCDLSANNSDALYGLAVRQSLDLPVVAVKDLKTIVIFGANDFDLLEYDESLRIDTVQKTTEVLGDALRKAVENKKERHQLLNRLSIAIPKAAPVANEFTPIPLIEEEEQKPKEPALPKISPLPDYVGDALTEKEIEKLKAGDFLFHLNYGKGKVNTIKSTGKDKLTSIEFESGTKVLMLSVSDYFRKVNK